MAIRVPYNCRLGADAEVKGGSNGEFTSFRVALKDEKDANGETIWVSGTSNGSVLAQYLRKGEDVTVIADRVFKEDTYRGKVQYTFIRPQVVLGDYLFVAGRGRLVADAAPFEVDGVPKDFAVPKLIANIENPKTGEKEAVPISFVLGAKGLEKLGQYLRKGNPVCVSGMTRVNNYIANGDGGQDARSELQMRNAEITLGRNRRQDDDSQGAPAAPTPQQTQQTQQQSQAPAPALMDDFDDNDIPL